MRTTSGRSSAGALDRLAAVRRLADDLDVGLGLEDHAEAGADQRLVVGDQDADGHARLTPAAGRARGSRARRAARCRARRRRARRVRACPPAHGRRPAPPWSAAVVGDLELDLVLAEAQRRPGSRRAGVLERVGQRLLHDPVGRRGRRRAAAARARPRPQLDGQAGLAHLLEQRGELAEPGWGPRPARRPRAACPAGAASRPAPRGRSPRSPRARSRAEVSSPRARARPPGLDDDHAHAVGDHVVELARDARALLGDPRARSRSRSWRAARATSALTSISPSRSA